MTLTIDLPRPMSTNNLFKNKKQGRQRTEEYNTWRWHAMAQIQNQKPFVKPNGPVRIVYMVGEVGVSPRMDGDNCLKCLTDALVENSILPDDNRQTVRGVGMEWVPGKEGVTAHIIPASMQMSVPVEISGVVS